MPTSPGERIRSTLEASRERADQLLARAEQDAKRLTRDADLADGALVAARLARLDALRRELVRNGRLIEAGSAGLIEAMAMTSARLAAMARTADFEPPPWRTDLAETIEFKLSETRELTVRLRRGPPDAPGEPGAS